MVEADSSLMLEPADRVREADEPRSPVVRFGLDKPLRLDAGIDLAPFQIAYQTYGTLNAERSNAVLICHALTGDQHVANVHPITQKSGLVGDHGRARPADRHRTLFRDLPERGRRLHGHHRPGLHQSEDRQALGPRSSGHHHPRHGARAGDAARPSRHRLRCSASPAARWAECRCCNGRRAIPSACSRHCRSPARRAIRRRTSPFTRSAARP